MAIDQCENIFEEQVWYYQKKVNNKINKNCIYIRNFIIDVFIIDNETEYRSITKGKNLDPHLWK